MRKDVSARYKNHNQENGKIVRTYQDDTNDIYGPTGYLWTGPIDGKRVIYTDASKRPDGNFYIGVFDGKSGFSKLIKVKTIQKAELKAIKQAANRKSVKKYGAEIRTDSLVAAQMYREKSTNSKIEIVVIESHCESDFGNQMADNFAKHPKKKARKLMRKAKQEFF